MTFLQNEDLIKFKNIIPILVLAFLCSLWIFPFALAVFDFLPTVYSQLVEHKKSLTYLMHFCFISGFLCLWLSWVMWAYYLINLFRSSDCACCDNSKALWKIRGLSILSNVWLLLFYSHAYIYCTIKMQDTSKEYIRSGAHQFYFIRSGLGWACLLLFLVLYKLNVNILKRSQNKQSEQNSQHCL